MDKDYLKAAIEAILFAKGEPVSINELGGALNLKRPEILDLLTELRDDYADSKRGIEIIKVDDSYELATKKDFYDVLATSVSLDNKYSFTEAMLETLAIIAYRQPVTRAQVEEIRGVSCATSMNRLVEYGLIYEADRLNAPGRPFLFETTDEFLKHFDLESLSKLPEVSEDLIVRMQLEVEEETKSIQEDDKEEDNTLTETKISENDNTVAETNDGVQYKENLIEGG